MIFETPEWRMVETHYPLTNREIASLRLSVQETMVVVVALILWGLAIAERNNQ